MKKPLHSVLQGLPSRWLLDVVGGLRSVQRTGIFDEVDSSWSFQQFVDVSVEMETCSKSGPFNSASKNVMRAEIDFPERKMLRPTSPTMFDVRQVFDRLFSGARHTKLCSSVSTPG